MRTPFIVLAALSLPAAAFAEPYAVAKLAYASADLPLGELIAWASRRA